MLKVLALLMLVMAGILTISIVAADTSIMGILLPTFSALVVVLLCTGCGFEIRSRFCAESEKDIEKEVKSEQIYAEVKVEYKINPMFKMDDEFPLYIANYTHAPSKTNVLGVHRFVGEVKNVKNTTTEEITVQMELCEEEKTLFYSQHQTLHEGMKNESNEEDVLQRFHMMLQSSEENHKSKR